MPKQYNNLNSIILQNNIYCYRQQIDQQQVKRTKCLQIFDLHSKQVKFEFFKLSTQLLT